MTGLFKIDDLQVSVLRFLNRPSVHIITGIIIILCGLTNMEEGIVEFFEKSNRGTDRIGLLIIGLSLTLTRGLISVFKFLENTAKGYEGTKRADGKVSVRLRNAVEHWLFELIGGILLLACGLIEVLENWLDNDAANNDHILWFFGLVAVGGVKIITTFPEMIDATVMLEHVEHKKGWNMRGVHYIGRKLRNRRLEIALAIFIMLLGIIEEVLLPVYREGYSFDLNMHHGILFYGFSHLTRILPGVMTSKALIQDAFAKSV